jgi:serine protease inhibitor
LNLHFHLTFTTLSFPATKIYVKNTISIQAPYKKAIIKYFQSDIETIDFSKNIEAVQTINDFVSNKTNGLIKEFLQENDVSDKTSMVLVNCIHFKGLWVTPFKKDQTAIGKFQLADGTTRMTDFMFTEGYFKLDVVEALENAFVVELPYVNSSLTFTLVVPQEVDGLGKVVAAARVYDWSKLSAKMQEQNIKVFMPKFNATFKQFLSNVMKNVSRTMTIIFGLYHGFI